MMQLRQIWICKDCARHCETSARKCPYCGGKLLIKYILREIAEPRAR